MKQESSISIEDFEKAKAALEKANIYVATNNIDETYFKWALEATEKPAGAFIPTVGYLTSVNDTKLTRGL